MDNSEAEQPQDAKTYAEIAGDYAMVAGELINGMDTLTKEGLARLADPVARQAAQVAATLSVGARIADLTERLEKAVEYVGDRVSEHTERQS